MYIVAEARLHALPGAVPKPKKGAKKVGPGQDFNTATLGREGARGDGTTTEPVALR